MKRSGRPETLTGRSIEKDSAYSVPEAAQLIGVSERWMWARVADGDIPSLKLGGRRFVLGLDLLVHLKRVQDEQRKAMDVALRRAQKLAERCGLKVVSA